MKHVNRHVKPRLITPLHRDKKGKRKKEEEAKSNINGHVTSRGCS